MECGRQPPSRDARLQPSPPYEATVGPRHSYHGSSLGRRPRRVPVRGIGLGGPKVTLTPGRRSSSPRAPAYTIQFFTYTVLPSAEVVDGPRAAASLARPAVHAWTPTSTADHGCSCSGRRRRTGARRMQRASSAGTLSPRTEHAEEVPRAHGVFAFGAHVGVNLIVDLCVGRAPELHLGGRSRNPSCEVCKHWARS